jgi:hypothetical protein
VSPAILALSRGHTIPIVILSAAETSRSEVPAKSKDPCTLSLRKGASGNSPRACIGFTEATTAVHTAGLQSDNSVRMNICLDTSAINALCDDAGSKVLITKIRSSHKVLLTSLSIVEIVANSVATRRQRLLECTKSFSGGTLPLAMPNKLVRRATRAVSKGKKNLALKVRRSKSRSLRSARRDQSRPCAREHETSDRRPAPGLRN